MGGWGWGGWGWGVGGVGGGEGVGGGGGGGGGGGELFRSNIVNIMVADALVLCVARITVPMILTM